MFVWSVAFCLRVCERTCVVHNAASNDAQRARVLDLSVIGSVGVLQLTLLDRVELVLSCLDGATLGVVRVHLHYCVLLGRSACLFGRVRAHVRVLAQTRAELALGSRAFLVGLVVVHVQGFDFAAVLGLLSVLDVGLLTVCEVLVLLRGWRQRGRLMNYAQVILHHVHARDLLWAHGA